MPVQKYIIAISWIFLLILCGEHKFEKNKNQMFTFWYRNLPQLPTRKKLGIVPVYIRASHHNQFKYEKFSHSPIH